MDYLHMKLALRTLRVFIVMWMLGGLAELLGGSWESVAAWILSAYLAGGVARANACINVAKRREPLFNRMMQDDLPKEPK